MKIHCDGADAAATVVPTLSVLLIVGFSPGSRTHGKFSKRIGFGYPYECHQERLEAFMNEMESILAKALGLSVAIVAVLTLLGFLIGSGPPGMLDYALMPGLVVGMLVMGGPH